MILPFGKGLFLWRPDKVADGTAEGIAQVIDDLGLDVVNLKVGSGVYTYPYNFDYRPIVDAIREQNPDILIFGWHYVYSENIPEYEVQIAQQQIEYLNLDGYSIDAESHYKQNPGFTVRLERAHRLMSGIKSICQSRNIPLGFTSYRYPLYHPELPWAGFLPYVDYVEMQHYWQPYPGVVQEFQLVVDQHLQQFSRLGLDLVPFFPAGRAYIGDGYDFPGPSAAELFQFMEMCKNWNRTDSTVTGFTFWSFDALYGHYGGDERYEAIRNFEWSDNTIPPPPDGIEERVIALENWSQGAEIQIQENRTQLEDHEIRIADLENQDDDNNEQPTTIQVRALEHFPLGIAVAWDTKCSGQVPPGKPTIEHPPTEDRIILNVGDVIEVKAQGVYSCKDTPTTPTILAAGRAEYYLAIEGYPDQDETFVDATKVEIV